MEKLERSVHDAPIIEKDDYEYLVHPISNCVPVLEPSLLREVVTRIVRAAELENVDKIVTPAAMGIHISTAVSLATDIPLVVIRKREYGLEGEVSLTQETGYSESEMYINDVDEGDNVLLLDDMLSTGGTLRAITEALESIGANIVDIVVAMRKVDGGDAMVDSEYDVASLLDIVVRDGEVTIIRDEEERQLVDDQPAT
ncbi:hypoxanthine/guanine phosphoribosyltransferase [Halostagnicola sp. A-GB9-2]|uniref:hypoxanthine/guanine phosphoribosyltransferase n=1 Tax=Halostagnicola sp. A-GB9-2 TaxID=3048066 RepID=UPI0024C002A4|nr:hypoxanthine/guanine phosphoribosyltransferase [Halostagnicola sp. A-GB9-2]MDJ1433348.1 hypoxanthine/guanine phosphoribosyltransferase [Halostagnicola sp. A-GB9-2]